MKRLSLVNGLLSLTAVSIMTGCVDDKYDLSNIDTTSRITVDNLTVPINLSEIRLENVINLDNNENISKVVIDNKRCYAIVKGGEIAPTQFSIRPVHVAAPSISPTALSVNIPGVSDVALPELNLPPISLPQSDTTEYEFKMENVDSALVQLKDLKTLEPLKVEVTLSVPSEIAGSQNDIAFRNLKIQLPWGLITDAAGYDRKSGLLSIDELAVGADGKARLTINATGLELGEAGYVNDGSLSVHGKVYISEGELCINVKNTVVPGTLRIQADYNVSSFDIASFSGKIDYNMDEINIDPISLSGLPDFLDSPETRLIIADPQILVNLRNPVGEYGLRGIGTINLTSTFKDDSSAHYTSSQFALYGNDASLAFCTPKQGYEFVEFDGLRYVLTNGDSGLPKSIKVDIRDINFSGDVVDFPLGDLGSAEGSYEFNAPLGFGAGSMVMYETKVDGWGSETLDDVYVNTIHVNATCTTDLPVSVQLSFVPLDRNGNEIPIREESALFSVPAKGVNHPLSLSIESLNGPITNLDGIRFKALVLQDNPDNTDALGPYLSIQLDDIRIAVDGYFETDL